MAPSPEGQSPSSWTEHFAGHIFHKTSSDPRPPMDGASQSSNLLVQKATHLLDFLLSEPLSQLPRAYHHLHVYRKPQKSQLIHPSPRNWQLSEVFSKTRASGLPPHWPYDCAIELLPGTNPPPNWIYPLSIAEQRAMEEYIQEAHQQRYIRPFTSPALARFYPVDKRGGGLRPCIDYQGFNQCSVKCCP